MFTFKYNINALLSNLNNIYNIVPLYTLMMAGSAEFKDFAKSVFDESNLLLNIAVRSRVARLFV